MPLRDGLITACANPHIEWKVTRAPGTVWSFCVNECLSMSCHHFFSIITCNAHFPFCKCLLWCVKIKCDLKCCRTWFMHPIGMLAAIIFKCGLEPGGQDHSLPNLLPTVHPHPLGSQKYYFSYRPFQEQPQRAIRTREQWWPHCDVIMASNGFLEAFWVCAVPLYSLASGRWSETFRSEVNP